MRVARLAAAAFLGLLWVPVAQRPAAAELDFEIVRTVARRGFDGETCWVHARAGAIPPQSPGNPSSQPIVVMTMQKLLLSGSDVFYALHEMRTDDLGRTWDGPRRCDSFARQQKGQNIETTVCDFTPRRRVTGRTVRRRTGGG